jgi:hypothetical protein
MQLGCKAQRVSGSFLLQLSAENAPAFTCTYAQMTSERFCAGMRTDLDIPFALRRENDAMPYEPNPACSQNLIRVVCLFRKQTHHSIQFWTR